MKTRLLCLPALLAGTALLVMPALAEDKKKKKKSEDKPSTLEQIQEQLRRQINPQPGPVAAAGQLVNVRVTNSTEQPVEFVWLNPDGTQQSYGFLQPTAPGGEPAVIETYGGHQWLFRINGRVVQTFTATNQLNQLIAIGQGGGRVVQVPPVVPQVPPVVPLVPVVSQPTRVVVPNPQPIPVEGGGLPPAPAVADVAPQHAQEFLQLHNDARARVGVPPLRWSNTLARFAQQWADHLASSGQFQHRDMTVAGYGENLFGGSEGGPGDAARFWLEEKRAYNGGPITPQNFATVGHYTQMIWRDSTEVGFGFARGSNGVIVVANYAPRGNRNNQKPY